jgi:hypothetical protein
MIYRLIITGVFVYLSLGTGFRLNAQTNCYLIVPAAQNVVDGSTIPPGSTICIAAGNRDYLLIRNIQGEANNPVIIKNFNGIVNIQTDHYYGIKISGCNHVILTGSGFTGANYGFRITGVTNGVGVSIDDMSSYVEISQLEVGNTKFSGIIAKTDPSCTNFSATREKFTMYDLNIHDCYLHDIGDEGFYIGSSKFTGQYLPGCDTTVLPHIIEGVSIYNNIIERTGWDGLQVSSSTKDCYVYGNTIKFDSQRETQDQMSGILIGGGSQCDCYNNIITDGKGDGIDYFGSGNQKIFNNLIVRPGRTFQPANPNLMKHGMFIGTAVDQNNTTLLISHNTIIAPKSTGIRFFNSSSTQNRIINNLITEPGSLPLMGEHAYFSHNLSSGQYEFSHNLLSNNIAQVKFLNYSNGNFDLEAGSPAVNAAKPTELTFDINNNPRPHNQLPDIGSFESQDPYAATKESLLSPPHVLLYPNPVREFLFIELPNTNVSLVNYQITNLIGHVLNSGQWQHSSSGEILKIDVTGLEPSVLILNVSDNKSLQFQNLILKQ